MGWREGVWESGVVGVGVEEAFLSVLLSRDSLGKDGMDLPLLLSLCSPTPSHRIQQ